MMGWITAETMQQLVGCFHYRKLTNTAYKTPFYISYNSDVHENELARFKKKCAEEYKQFERLRKDHDFGCLSYPIRVD